MKNRYIFTYIITIILCGMLQNGCKKKAPKSSEDLIIGKNEKKISEMGAADIVVKVGNVKLTCGEYNKILKTNEKNFEFAHRNADKGLIKSYVHGREKTVIREFITRQLFLDDAQKNHIEVNDSLVQSYMADFEKFLKKNKVSKSKYLLATELTEDDLNRKYRERALIEEYLKNQLGDKLQVTPEDIEEEKKEYIRYNQISATTNACIMAYGKSIVEKIQSGADFTLMAIEHSEEEGNEGVGVWGEFTRLQIEDKNIRKDAFSLPIGSVSGPYDTDEGMVIIKIKDRKGTDSTVSLNSAVVELDRIFVKMWKTFECPGEKDLIKRIEMKKKSQYIIPLVNKLKKNEIIEFPNGTNLWDNVQQNMF